MNQAVVGCAGILVADTFCGPLSRLPLEGELLIVDSMPASAGGCAANVAIGLAKQGIAVDVAGCVGRDAPSEILLSAFRHHGIGCAHVLADESHPTSTTFILIVEGQDRRYVHAFGANRAFRLSLIDREWLSGLRVFYLGGLFAMPGIVLEELGELLRFCRSRNVITVVDVVMPQVPAALRDLAPVLPWIDYFLPNDDEARQITGLDNPMDQLRALSDHGTETVVITRGTKGAVARSGGKVWQWDAFAMNSVDPSGAGDAFAAGLITGVVNGWDLPHTICYASALGGSATLAVGTTDGVFTAAQAEAYLKEHTLEVVASAMPG